MAEKVLKILKKVFEFSNFVHYLSIYKHKIVIMSTNTTAKPKRSIKLSSSELADVKSRASKYPTMVAAGIGMGVNRDVLMRIMAIGSCSEQTYKLLFPDKEVQ